MSFISSLFSSTGLKRRIASLVNVLIAALAVVPQAAPIVKILQLIAAAVGGVGVVHAGLARNLSANKAATLSSLLAAAIAYASHDPRLVVFVPLLQVLAGLLGASAITSKN